MALTPQNKKMRFNENRDIEKVISNGHKGAVKRVNVNFEADKHTLFKSACARRGVTISDVINELVDRWLKDES